MAEVERAVALGVDAIGVIPRQIVLVLSQAGEADS
jgi:hypothetical protein